MLFRSKEIRQRVAEAVTRLKEHPCVLGFLVGNEIEKTLVRWMGPHRVQRFLEGLIAAGREIAAEKLFSYATYPSTEYLIPRNADFLAVNVYLEQQKAFAAYLQRLQNLAGSKPLIITEFGLDVAKHGEAQQAEVARWFWGECDRAAVGGTVWFSYTDEWFRGGEEVTQWCFGIVDAERLARHASSGWREPSAVPTPDTPKVTIIVCTYNGTATLRPCLDSLQRMHYPDFEVLIIDDGSTQDIADIAKDFAQMRYVRQEHAGLSVARNLGASLATGEILAYTDDDCIADEDWLHHLAPAFDDPQWVAAGGPNIPPSPRNRTEAIVAAAPGAPAHVLLSDIEAEHLPGCNLAIRKSALEAIGGFRAHYRVAGDDVDICWRLRAAGGRLRFIPGAMVWHHRRYTVAAYLRQQRGYGHAEALLMADHPQHFGPLGGARWRGGIYGDHAATLALEEGGIFHGPFGNGLFQGIYQQGQRCLLHWMSGVLWIAFAIVALLCHRPAAAAAFVALSLVIALCRLRHLPLPPFALQWPERLLLLSLCWLQPIVREWERLRGMVRLRARPSWKPTLGEVFEPDRPRKAHWQVGLATFWNEQNRGREDWLRELCRILEEQGIEHRVDDGWRWFDVELHPRRWVSLGLSAVTEHHGQGRCLTRVRLTQRVSKRLLAAAALMMAVVICFGSLDDQVPTWGYFALLLSQVFLLSLSVYLFVSARFLGRRQVELAAERCGLESIPYETPGG